MAIRTMNASTNGPAWTVFARSEPMNRSGRGAGAAAPAPRPFWWWCQWQLMMREVMTAQVWVAWSLAGVRSMGAEAVRAMVTA